MKTMYRGSTNFHSTHDSISEGAAKALKVAAFPSDHSAICECAASGGKLSPSDCNGLTVYSGDNDEVCHFSGKQWRARQADDGTIEIYRVPFKQTQDGTCCRAMLVGINKKNSAFWERKEA
jgi:hypothetical protein